MLNAFYLIVLYNFINNGGLICAVDEEVVVNRVNIHFALCYQQYIDTIYTIREIL